MNPCVLLYDAAANGKIYGTTEGICRITGLELKGIPFEKWVSDRFNNWGDLHSGTIISNEALFCFDEASALIQNKTGRDKLQRFRTYSHIITQNDEWHTVTKADKAKIVDLLRGNPKVVCLTDSGQKHIFFKNRLGMWQLDDTFIVPDIQEFDRLHGVMMQLLDAGFTQTEVLTGKYKHASILKYGLEAWQELEFKIQNQRGEPLFDFAAWLMFTIKIKEE